MDFFPGNCIFGIGYVIARDVQWIDVDGDGLEDPVCRFDWKNQSADCANGGPTPYLWFRNLGLDVPGLPIQPRLPGDLNLDCLVDGADIGILLTEFGNICD